MVRVLVQEGMLYKLSLFSSSPGHTSSCVVLLKYRHDECLNKANVRLVSYTIYIQKPLFSPGPYPVPLS